MILGILIGGLVALAGTGVKTNAGAKSAVTAEVAVPSWASSLQGVWYLEEGSTNTRVSSGSCTTSCGLTPGSAATNSSTTVIQGSYSNYLVDTNLSCTNANCGSSLAPVSSGGSGGSVTYGCWVSQVGFRSTADNPLIRKHDGTNGYLMSLRFSTRDMICQVGSTSVDGASFIDYDRFFHLVCVFDDSTNTLTPYVGGKADAAGATVTSIGSNTKSFLLGDADNGGDYNIGYLDECFVSKSAMSAEAICRVCSCGIDGSLCGYNLATSAWGNKGRNLSHCGGCALPADPTQSAP